jgi:hypothetical protein
MSDELLYRLMPAVYRDRDLGQGQPLRALLGTMNAQYDRLHANVMDLYDAWFVETCAEWMLPYLAAQVGVPGLDDPLRIFSTTRARVGNAVRYARRKGTPWALSNAVRDATGWPARVVEGWEHVGWAQSLADVRLGYGGTLSLHPAAGAAEVQTAFDPAARTVDLRVPGPPREAAQAGDDGRWAPGGVALFVWRLRSYPVALADAAPHDAARGRWRFHPAGVDAPLFHPPADPPPMGVEPSVAQVPAPLTAVELAGLLQAERDTGRGDPLPVPPDGWPLLRVEVDDEELSAEQVAVMDLDGWPEPLRGVRAAVDPVRGRLAFGGTPPARVRVGWAYGLSGTTGGGPYSRAATLAAPVAGEWHGWVGPGAPREWAAFASLDAALAAWKALPAGRAGRLRLAGSARHVPAGAAFGVQLLPGQSLALESADGDQAVLAGPLRVDACGGGALVLDGLVLAHGVGMRGTPSLTVRHCTVRGAIAHGHGSAPAVAVRRSFTGPVRLSADATLDASDSVVDGCGGWAVAADSEGRAGPRLTIQACTVLGRVHVRHLQAVDSIFRDPVRVEAHTLARAESCALAADPAHPLHQQAQCTDEAPLFTSVRLGDPGYAQLSTRAPHSIREGARNGSEMGAWCRLRNPQREANLREVLDEQLPMGLRAAVIYAT